MKPTLKKIVKEGFKPTGYLIQDLELYHLDYDRILYDPKKDTVELTFEADDKFELEDMVR